MRCWIGILLVVALGGTAASHSWYPANCCSDKDCRQLADAENPVEIAGGFQFPNGRKITYRQVQPSPDEHWHICESPTATEVPSGLPVLICVFGPIGSM